MWPDSRVFFLPWRSLPLGAFVSVGGIIFGYDAGQISGFLEMNDFKRRLVSWETTEDTPSATCGPASSFL